MRTILTLVLLALSLYYWPVGMALTFWAIGAILVQAEVSSQLALLNEFDFPKQADIIFLGRLVVFGVLPILSVLSVIIIWSMLGGMWLE